MWILEVKYGVESGKDPKHRKTMSTTTDKTFCYVDIWLFAKAAIIRLCDYESFVLLTVSD